MDTEAVVYPGGSQSMGGMQVGEKRSAFAVLASGAKLALRYWPAWLLMMLGTLLPALLAALIPSLDLLKLAHRPAIQRMAEGIPAWLVIDLEGLLSGGAVQAGGSEVANSLALLLLGFVFMPLLGGLVSAFLYGGVLLTYREAPQPFRIRRFAWGSWHWFGAFLALALIQALLFVLIFLPLMGLLAALGSLGTVGQAAALAVFLLAAVMWVMIFEMGRARMMIAGTRNPFRGIGQAFGWFFRQPLGLLGYYSLALLLLLAVQALFRLGINPNIPLDVLLLALFVQQGFIAVRLFMRAMRLAGLMLMAQPGMPAEAQPAGFFDFTT